MAAQVKDERTKEPKGALGQAERIREESGDLGPAPASLTLESQGQSFRRRYDGEGSRLNLRDLLAQPIGVVQEVETPWAVRMTAEFRDSVNKLARAKRSRKQKVWGQEQRLLLVNQVRQVLQGQTSLLEESRGKAGSANVKKFKWNGQGLRVFVHLDEAQRTLTLLDVRLKSPKLQESPLPEMELMLHGSAGQSAFYDELADRVTDLERRLVRGVHGEASAIWTALRKMQEQTKHRPGLSENGLGIVDFLDEEASAVAPRHFGASAASAQPPVLEGQLDVAQYQPPKAESRKAALYTALHFAFLGVAMAVLILALGWIPVTLVSAVRGVQLYREFATAPDPFQNLLRKLPDPEEFLREMEPFREESKRLVRFLLFRLGMSVEQAPQVEVFPISNMGALGRGLDASAEIHLAPRYRIFPAHLRLAVLAHELGHLYLGHTRGLWWLRISLSAAWARKEILQLMRWSAVVYLATQLFLGPPGLLALTLAGLAVGVAWISAMSGLFFGLAATRQREFIADHFAAWLTKPEWLRDFFASYWRPLRSGPPPNFWERLRMDHPSIQERGQWLEPIALAEQGLGILPELPDKPQPDQYQRPRSIVWKQAFYLGAHYTLLAAGVVSLAAGLGLPAFLVGMGLGLTHLLVESGLRKRAVAVQEAWKPEQPDPRLAPEMNERLRRVKDDVEHTLGESGRMMGPYRGKVHDLIFLVGLNRFLAMVGMPDLDEQTQARLEPFLLRVDGILEDLRQRLGVSLASPNLVVYAGENNTAAYATGKTLDNSAVIGIGEGHRDSPDEHVATLLAHEIGHLVLKRRSWSPYFNDRRGARNGFVDFGKLAGYGVLASLAYQLIAGFAAPWALMASGALVLASGLLVGVGLLFALAWNRQKEFMMDHFSAWLTKPEWFLSYKEALAVKEGRYWHPNLWKRLLSDHPSDLKRIRFLDRLLSRQSRGAEQIPPWPGKPNQAVLLNGRSYILKERIDGGGDFTSAAIYRVAGPEKLMLQMNHPVLLGNSRLRSEVEALQALGRTDIPHARLRAFSADYRVVVKDLAEGPRLSELLKQGPLVSEQVAGLAELFARLIEIGYEADLQWDNLAWNKGRWVLMNGEGFQQGRPWKVLQRLVGALPMKGGFTHAQFMAALRGRLGPKSPAWKEIEKDARIIDTLALWLSESQAP